MGLTYFRRYRMETELSGRDFLLPQVPGYRLLPWDPSLIEAHAETKHLSFRNEIDAHVFPCLGEFAGCLRLMQEISQKEGFLPEATWLVAWENLRLGSFEYCGTIQGVRDRSGMGAIQNLGITPEHRGRGLGSVLLYRALEGFRQRGLQRAFLEVTARNSGAIRLYRRLGFVRVKTVYKPVEVAYS